MTNPTIETVKQIKAARAQVHNTANRHFIESTALGTRDDVALEAADRHAEKLAVALVSQLAERGVATDVDTLLGYGVIVAPAANITAAQQRTLAVIAAQGPAGCPGVGHDNANALAALGYVLITIAYAGSCCCVVTAAGIAALAH